MDADGNAPCGLPKKPKDCKKNGVYNIGTHMGNDENQDLCDPLSKIHHPAPARAQMDGDDCDPYVNVAHKANDGNRGLCNFKPISHGYRLVDDFIFSDRSLVGVFTRLRPSVQELFQWSKSNWVSKLRSIWGFKIVGEGFFKIEFFDKDDCEFVFENGPWFMGVAGLTLKRWNPNFDPQNPGPLNTPVWMSLPDLPLEFWNEETLVKICSVVGNVLQIDESGSSTIARVCVEVDLREGLPSTVNLRCSGVSVTQELDYDGIPFRCKVCRSTEHQEGSCPRKGTKSSRKKGNVLMSSGLWSSGK
uniref:DUF4283 domain-containing protein n=1 Tax=Araucaria cunninghamii TaxID=56994 RepID=A0A0D6R8S9_ARACU